MNKIKPTIIFLTLLLSMALFPYIPLYIFNIDINKFNQTMKVLYNFACDIGFMIIIFFLYFKETINDFKSYFHDFRENFEISFKYYFIGLIIMIISNLTISFFFSNASANNEETIRSLISLYPLYMLFSVSIYAPFIEENIFRRSIKDSIQAFNNSKITKYLYIIISGLIFSALHVIGMTSNYIDYLYIIPYLALGSTFAALYYKTNNIFSTIIMHSLHNTVAIILYLIAGVV